MALMKVVNKRGDVTWYGHWREHGRQVKRALGSSKREAVHLGARDGAHQSAQLFGLLQGVGLAETDERKDTQGRYSPCWEKSRDSDGEN
jgi:hypothetical protein